MSYSPIVDYRSDRVELSPEGQGEPRSGITDIATRAALSIALVVWTVVGFILWIPLLLREILAFVGALTFVTLTNGDPAPAGRRLRRATSFYRRGFETATRCVLADPGDGSDDAAGATPVPKPVQTRPVLLEIAWALVVWYPVLLWLGIAELTPADLWRWGADVPWSEIARSSVEATGAWVEELVGRLGL